jgi:cysteine desulfurase
MSIALVNAKIRLASQSSVGRLRAHLERGLMHEHPNAVILGASAPRLPNTTFVRLPGIDAGDLVDFMAANDIAISVGSACAHGAQSPSYVAQAMGLDHAAAQQCIRVSLSEETTAQDIEAFLTQLGAYS